MKNTFKYMLVAVAGAMVFASCQELEDFNTTIDAAPVLAYTPQGGLDNIHSTKVAHAPVGSFGSYETVFPVQCNSSSHNAMQVEVVYSAEAAQAYATEHSTAKLAYSVLPAEYLKIEKYVYNATEGAAAQAPVLSLPENARFSSDSVKVSLTGDLSRLTEKRYVAAISFKPSQYAASEDLGTYYLEVLTEINCIRPISSIEDVAGFRPSDRSSWTASANGNSFSPVRGGSFSDNTVEIVVDMAQKHLLTGIVLGLYYPAYYPTTIEAIEYSTDGENWEQAGTPDDAALISGNDMYIAFYGYLPARYVKFTATFSNSWGRRITSFNIVEVESETPTLYFDYNSNNTVNALVKHMPSGSVSTLDLAVSVKVAPAGTSTITGTVAVDNTLIDAYNTANGTQYEAMPAGNVNLQYSNFTIGGGTVKSDNVQLSLAGDLSGLKSSKGYLLPVSISSSAAVSQTRGVIYVIVESMEQMLKANPTSADLAGLTLVDDRSGWSAMDADGNAVSDVFGESSWGGSDANPIIVDMGKEYSVGAIGIGTVYANYGNSYRATGFTLAYSQDGVNFTGIGVATSSDMFWNNPYMVSVIDGNPVTARYIRISDVTARYFYGVNNINVYVK